MSDNQIKIDILIEFLVVFNTRWSRYEVNARTVDRLWWRMCYHNPYMMFIPVKYMLENNFLKLDKTNNTITLTDKGIDTLEPYPNIYTSFWL